MKNYADLARRPLLSADWPLGDGQGAWITVFEISLHNSSPHTNPTVLSLFIQNLFLIVCDKAEYLTVDFLENFAYSSRYFSKRRYNFHSAICFAYSCIFSVQFWSEIPQFPLQIALNAFSLAHYSPSWPHLQANIQSIKIVFKLKEAVVYSTDLLNLVNVDWL